jgi:MFS family permease
MAEYSESSSILISLIIGAILSFLFDNIFVITFIGFLSTYMINREEKTYLVGVMTALIFVTLNFAIGMVLSPEIPSRIKEQIGIDSFNLIVGFFVALFLGGILGFIGGYLAENAYNYIHPSSNDKKEF